MGTSQEAIVRFVQLPPVLKAIESDTHQIEFTLPSEPKTGSLLRTLAASKPGGRVLATWNRDGHWDRWLLAGVDSRSRLVSEIQTRRCRMSRSAISGMILA